MCCLRYEHEFYVLSRKRFPKEGKIVVTSRGEEKVLAIDIFRERLTLRNIEGETRVVALPDFDREVADRANGVQPGEIFQPDEESGDELEEISPELIYTTEHEVPGTHEHIVMETAPVDSAVAEGEEGGRAGDRDDSGAKRRRGRRGGRRGRGSEQGDR
jgi:hypothetical protein